MRRKDSGGGLRPRPPLPMRLQVYSPVLDADADEARADYLAWEAERSAWHEEYAHLPVVDQPPDDEPFCGELDEHDCRGADCRRKPAPST